MTRVARSRTIRRSSEDVWEVLADFGAISTWAPNVDHSCLLRSPGDDRTGGIGVVRRIQDGRTTVLERIVTWDEPKVLAYGIEGLPAVVRSLRNEWRLEPQGGDGTLVTLTSSIDCGSRPPQKLIARIVGRRMAQASDAMVSGLARSLEDPSHG